MSKNENHTYITIYLTKINDAVTVTVVGEAISLHEFGLHPEQFHILGQEIENVFHKILNDDFVLNSGDRYPSKF